MLEHGFRAYTVKNNLNMKLLSFNIKHFRSIENCGWQNLSNDNVTGLVGQNESGKTSVLEGLYAFSTGKIESNDLRDKDERPVITCSFLFDEALVQKIESSVAMPEVLRTLLLEKGYVNLSREWSDDKNSVFKFEQVEVNNFFANQIKPAPVVKEKKIEEPIADAEEQGDAVAEEVVTEETVEPEPVPVPYLEGKALLDILIAELPIFELFTDYISLLPDYIDLEDIQSQNKKAEGLRGAINLLKIANLDINFLQSGDDRLVETEIDKLNKEVATDFQDFWSQKIGKNNKIKIEFVLKHHKESEPKPGKPYVSFWINDGQSKLYPKQRSKGVRWFTSFYLELKANSSTREEHSRDKVILIDEPGGSLHAKAQADVLKVMNQISDSYQVVYTTHSPYLIDTERMYRLLAVQRSDVEDERSNTVIFDAHSLGAAHTDTLSPVFTSMGVDFASQTVIKKKGNLVVEEISALYYLKSFAKLIGKDLDISYMPATGVTNVPMICNLFLGWGIKFSVLVDDDNQGRRVYNELKKNLFFDKEEEANKYLIKVTGNGIEDIFTKTDFKKWVFTGDTTDLGDSNAQFLAGKAISKGMLAAQFFQAVEDGTVTWDGLNATTKTQIEQLIGKIEASIANH